MFSSQTISPGSTPLVLSTQRMAGLYTPQLSSPQPAGLNLYSGPTNQTAKLPLLYNPQVSNTNTIPLSSFETPTGPYTYHSITPNPTQTSPVSSWLSNFKYIGYNILIYLQLFMRKFLSSLVLSTYLQH